MSDPVSIPKSRRTHLFKMAAKMALKQGQKYLTTNPESRFNSLLDQADILVNHVGRLKGAAMKAVQTLSVEGYDFLPKEVMDILEKLQSQAPPLPSHILRQEIRDQLGEERFAQLKDLSDDPIAAASIGQVYEATYLDQPVVIKVQYPGVAESVDADIDTLKKLIKGFLVVTQKKIEMDDLMEEARRVLKLETDYRNEEKALLQYKQNFSGTDYIIPKVYSEFTTAKVLVMSREPGLEFSPWLKSNPSPEERQSVADQLLNLYMKEFFANRLVQTDPNPANFLVHNGQLVLLDFGATMEFSPQFVQDYLELLRAVFSGQREAIISSIYKMQLLDPRENQETQQAFIDFLGYSLVPFDPKLQPFDFKDDQYSFEVRKEAMRFSRMLKYSAPPKTLIFLHRKLGGIFMLLKKLGVQANLLPFREVILNKTLT
jgi:aarF domain-containing kinase